jgi:hypothetical protein
MVRTSQAEKETACLHPEMEEAMMRWLTTRSHPAFLLIGPPGVGKTTMVYRVCRAGKYWIQEFNASHTRTGSSFRQTIMPLLTETGVSKWIHPETPNGRAVLLDEMDGLSQGEKGGLQELLDYLKTKRDFSQDCPLILVCNVLEGRTIQQLLKYCCVQYVQMPKKEKLVAFFGAEISDRLYQLGDIRKVYHTLHYHEQVASTAKGKEEAMDQNLHVAIRAAWFTLFEHWGINDELDLETKDANLAGLLFHQNLPLFLETMPFAVYETLLDHLRWSDRADFWAFFHQCWNLLPLSYRLKLKFPNLALQAYSKPAVIPPAGDLQYTQVLTKQSALFNAWKEMNRVSNEYHVPFRCVTQWASRQTGKLQETLGLDVRKREAVSAAAVSAAAVSAAAVSAAVGAVGAVGAPLLISPSGSPNEVESHGVAALYPLGAPIGSKGSSSRKRVSRGKK